MEITSGSYELPLHMKAGPGQKHLSQRLLAVELGAFGELLRIMVCDQVPLVLGGTWSQTMILECCSSAEILRRRCMLCDNIVYR